MGISLIPAASTSGAELTDIAKSTANGGRYALDTLALTLSVTQRGMTDSLCFAPLNKASLLWTVPRGSRRLVAQSRGRTGNRTLRRVAVAYLAADFPRASGNAASTPRRNAASCDGSRAAAQTSDSGADSTVSRSGRNSTPAMASLRAYSGTIA